MAVPTFEDDSSSSSSSSSSKNFIPSKTVVVLGAAYAGLNASSILARTLPPDWKLIVIDKTTHFHHLYAFPRVSILPTNKLHSQKTFIPRINMFTFDNSSKPTLSEERMKFIHANVIEIFNDQNHQNSTGVGKGGVFIEDISESSSSIKKQKRLIEFDYLVYALGSKLPAPIDVSNPMKNFITSQNKSNQILIGGKEEGVDWMKKAQDQIQKAKRIIIVGGGPLGVQMASDIAYIYGTQDCDPLWTNEDKEAEILPEQYNKSITLLSSRTLLPRFQNWMHEEAKKRLEDLGVKVMINSRAEKIIEKEDKNGKLIEEVIINSNKESIECDLLLICTGQIPNTDLLRQNICKGKFKDSIDEKSQMVIVNRSLQLSLPMGNTGETLNNDQIIDNIFIVGDCADAFGALNAGHTAYDQARLAARNIARLIAREYKDEIDGGKNDFERDLWSNWKTSCETLGNSLEQYKAPPHGIKVSMGIDESIVERNGSEHLVMNGGREDLNTLYLWDKWKLSKADLSI